MTPKEAIQETVEMARIELAKGNRIAAREAADTALREASKYGLKDLCTEVFWLKLETRPL